MNSNKKYNQAALKQYRKELKAMLDDIEYIDIKVLSKSVNIGVGHAKKNTPVGVYPNKQGGFMRKSWKSTPLVKTANGAVVKSLVNNADYSSYVNYGHRIVNKNGETIGFVKGQFMLEKAVGVVEKELVKNFKKEVERVSKKHGK